MTAQWGFRGALPTVLLGLILALYMQGPFTRGDKSGGILSRGGTEPGLCFQRMILSHTLRLGCRGQESKNGGLLGGSWGDR